MNNTTGIKAFGPVLLIFIFTTALFIVAKSTFTGWGIDTNVLLIGNVLLFLAAAAGYYLYTRSMHSKNPHAIVRTVYGSIMAKMMIVLISAFIYFSAYGKNVNKGAVFGCMFLYLLYTFVEVAILMKLSKQNKHV
jgi:hypothetical protein